MPPRPLTLALATIEYPPDPLSSGIGSYTRTLARLLNERGHRVHVVTRGTDGDSVRVEEGVRVHRLTPERPTLPERLDLGGVLGLLGRSLPGELRYRRRLAATLTRLVDEEGVDLIEAADHLAEPGFYRPQRRPWVPFVVRLHTPLAYSELVDPNIPELARRGVARLERSLLRRATHLSAPSRVGAERFLETLAVDREATVFPNPPARPLPAHAAVPERPATVLFVGRISRWKGVHLLVQAIPDIAAARPDAEFVFVGSDNVAADGYPSLTAALLAGLDERLRERVRFVGHVPPDEVGRFLGEATVCVLPSLFDNFPYTCLEAMSHGKAVVGSRNGGMAEMLADGEAGLLFTPPDVAGLRDRVLQLLADPELRRRLGGRARERVQRVYSQEAVVAQAEAFYRQAVAERRERRPEG